VFNLVTVYRPWIRNTVYILTHLDLHGPARGMSFDTHFTDEDTEGQLETKQVESD
jgi:hypothetical protein